LRNSIIEISIKTSAKWSIIVSIHQSIAFCALFSLELAFLALMSTFRAGCMIVYCKIASRAETVWCSTARTTNYTGSRTIQACFAFDVTGRASNAIRIFVSSIGASAASPGSISKALGALG
jgi:hypothetical protein